MTVQLPSVFYFQVMRAALRFYKQNKTPTGKELRVQMTAASKTGEFLERLVDWGLLKIVKDVDDLFDNTYAITRAGGVAAEYGEWDGDPKTWRAVVPKAPVQNKPAAKPPQSVPTAKTAAKPPVTQSRPAIKKESK